MHKVGVLRNIDGVRRNLQCQPSDVVTAMSRALISGSQSIGNYVSSPPDFRQRLAAIHRYITHIRRGTHVAKQQLGRRAGRRLICST